MDDCVKAKQSKERKTEREEKRETGQTVLCWPRFTFFWGINCKHPDGDFCVNICRHFRIFNVKIADPKTFLREREENMER